MLDLAMRDHHPWLQIVVGQRGHGKSQTIGRILCDWPQSLGTTLAIDPMATDPPLPSHIAYWATRWRRSAPDSLDPSTGMVACDEAKAVLTGDRHEKPLFRALFLRGRHMGQLGPDGRRKGISVIMGGQRPVHLPPDAFTQADRVVIHLVRGRSDLERIEALPGMEGHAALRLIPHLPPGYAVIWDARQGIFLPEVPGWRKR